MYVSINTYVRAIQINLLSFFHLLSFPKQALNPHIHGAVIRFIEFTILKPWFHFNSLHFRYKTIIVVSAIIGIALFALSLWTSTIVGLILIQICFGSFMAAEVAYYTYIYAKVERNKYQLVTSQTRSAILTGRFLGSVIGQVMVSTALMNYRQLNYLSLGCKDFIIPSMSIQSCNSDDECIMYLMFLFD